MALSPELITQFAKITRDKKDTRKEMTVYGTVTKYDGDTFVKLDGSELLTPVIITADAEEGERVSVLLKNHTATVTGNISSPSARTETVRLVSNDVASVEILVADTVKTSELEATELWVSNQLTAQNAKIASLETVDADVKGRLTAVEADILKLTVGDTITTETLNATYAKIDFSNITNATMETFYAKSGLIRDVTIDNSTITGRLVGVLISGDLIEAETLVANKLIIKGEDGLYYKLNTDGIKTEAEQTDYNSLNGTIIKAKSITASKISVSDLVAFGATIGGFHITANSLYSGVKASVNNTTSGLYFDSSGQFAFGDPGNYVKYYEYSSGKYKLDIAVDTLTVGVNSTDVENAIYEACRTATDFLDLSSSGLVVGQNPSSPTAGNTLISNDGVTIRKGTTVLAAFKAATRAASDISSATLTSTDSSDSESDGTTSVSGTVTSGETRANVYISTNGNPVYFPNGLETNKVIINDASGIISNANILLNGSLVDKSGEGVLTPLNSYGNMVIGYGRYQDGGGTYVYGTLVKAKTKKGFSASVNGVSAIDTNNSSGNATFGWHLYEAYKGETNIYGKITSLFAKDDIRLNASGNNIRVNGDIVPYETDSFNMGSPSLAFQNIYFSSEKTSALHGIRYADISGNSYNAIGVNTNGHIVYGNTTYCTNIVGRSTTTSNTGYSFKITCGDNPELTLGDSDARLLLFGGTDSTSRYIGSVAAYKRTYSASANMVITDNSIIGRATSSSRRYKKDIADLSLDSVRGLYKLPVRQYKYKADYISQEDERYEIDIPGFIAEEVEEYLPIACDHIRDDDGNLIPEMWNSKIIVPALLKLIQDLNGRIKKLEEVGM